MSDLDRTDIIGGLRAGDTPPLPLPTSHRRRRRDMPWWAWVAIWGAPAAAVAGLVGWYLGGPSGHRPPTAVVSSPSSSTPAAEAPVSLPPSLGVPSPRFSVTRSAPAASPTTEHTRRPTPTVTASPTPTRTHSSSPAPSPTRSRETGSPAPSDTPPTPSDSPEATDG
jgi:hypothetical protein